MAWIPAGQWRKDRCRQRGCARFLLQVTIDLLPSLPPFLSLSSSLFRFAKRWQIICSPFRSESLTITHNWGITGRSIAILYRLKSHITSKIINAFLALENISYFMNVTFLSFYQSKRSIVTFLILPLQDNNKRKKTIHQTIIFVHVTFKTISPFSHDTTCVWNVYETLSVSPPYRSINPKRGWKIKKTKPVTGLVEPRWAASRYNGNSLDLSPVPSVISSPGVRVREYLLWSNPHRRGGGGKKGAGMVATPR